MYLIFIKISICTCFQHKTFVISDSYPGFSYKCSELIQMGIIQLYNIHKTNCHLNVNILHKGVERYDAEMFIQKVLGNGEGLEIAVPLFLTFMAGERSVI